MAENVQPARAPYQTSFKLPSDLSQRLSEAAEDRGLGITRLAERLIREGLGRLIPADDIPLTR